MNYLGRTLTVDEKENDGRISLIAEPKTIKAVEEALKTTKEIKNKVDRTKSKTAFKSELKVFNLASYSIETEDRLSSIILSIGELLSKPIFIIHLPVITTIVVYLILKGGKA